jgi:hypothetical protein
LTAWRAVPCTSALTPPTSKRTLHGLTSRWASEPSQRPKSHPWSERVLENFKKPGIWLKSEVI